jgi:hypothetical protein
MKSRSVLVILVLAAAACGSSSSPAKPASTGPATPMPDLGATPAVIPIDQLPVLGASVDAGDPAVVTCGAASCASGQECRFGACIDSAPPCTTDRDCQDDSFCNGGLCTPFGLGPNGSTSAACKRLEAPGIFAPTVQCEWRAPADGTTFPQHRNVLSTPLVVDFDFDGDPKTLHPSIVFIAYNCDDGNCGQDPGCSGVLRIIDGKTCADQYTIGSVPLIGDVTPAIGDLDGDGRPDIVAEHIGGGIAGFRFNPSKNAFEEMWSGFQSTNADGCHWDSLAIHDLDDDGVPEILQNGPHPAVYDTHGVAIAVAPQDTSYAQMLHPVAADVDGDGAVEMVDGREMFRFVKATRSWERIANTVPGATIGFTALADFGTFGDNPAGDDRSTRDGVPEIAVVSSGHARVQTLSGRIVFDAQVPGGLLGGAPTVADFDGDGRAEFGVAGANAYAVFDPDCNGHDAANCRSGSSNGILWQKASRDDSKVTGSSVFDFDGDGRAEVVYGDECYSRVYDGRNGDVLFSAYRTSCTWYENPVVADVDGDFRAELVMNSNNNCGGACPSIDPVHPGVRCATTSDCPGATTCAREQPGDPYGLCRCTADADCGSSGLACVPTLTPSTQGNVCRAHHPAGESKNGVTVLRDAHDRWVGSRPIWNQHAYAVTGVNDDGTIPRTSAWKPNWKQPGLNNFRMNVQGARDPMLLPDLTVRGTGDPGVHEVVPCTDGVPHLGAVVCNRGLGGAAAGQTVTFTSSGATICTVHTTGALAPGACETVGCDWTGAPSNTDDVHVTVAALAAECNVDNNSATIRGANCVVIIK